MFGACTPSEWEYKIIEVEGDTEVSEEYDPFVSNSFNISEDDLNAYGQSGWELVSTYTTVETVHPNFGDDKYVTGLRENTRTSTITFIFKRPLKKK